MDILEYHCLLKKATDKLDQAMIEAGIFNYISDTGLLSVLKSIESFKRQTQEQECIVRKQREEVVHQGLEVEALRGQYYNIETGRWTDRGAKQPLPPFYDIGAHYCSECGFRTEWREELNWQYCWRCKTGFLIDLKYKYRHHGFLGIER